MIGFKRRAQRVAGGDVLKADERDDVAGVRFLDVLAVVGVHQEHAPDLLALVLDRVQHHRRRLELARIDAREGQRADESVGHDLEGERAERGVVRRLADLVLVFHVDAVHRRNVERARHIVDDGVEQRLDALVLERRPAQHRHEREGERALADQHLELGRRRLGALEVRLHQRVVLLDGHLDQLGARARGGVLEVIGNILVLELRAEALLEPDDRTVLDEVDETDEITLEPDRQVQHRRARAEAVLDHLDAAVEVRARAVELVDEAHPRHFVLVGLAPDGLRLRLDAGDAVEARDRAVEDAQASARPRW